MRDANMFDVVRVSDQRLIGEIIEMHDDRASIQVYEETSGLGPGEPVESSGAPLSVELGPGLIGSIFDGIQRPLDDIMRVSGTNLKRGVEVPSLKREKKWRFEPAVEAGASVVAGDVLGTVQETEVVLHKIMVPSGVMGTVLSIAPGEYTVEDAVAVIRTPNGVDQPVTLMQKLSLIHILLLEVCSPEELSAFTLEIAYTRDLTFQRVHSELDSSPVSYTHLDVYKRQPMDEIPQSGT